MQSFTFNPIGIIKTPYKEKFSVPRQPGLADAATADLYLLPPYNQSNAVIGLEQFSHIWLLFVFDKINSSNTNKLMVRPPRLGGNQRIGVFASRSTFRPNPIGLSSVKLLAIETSNQQIILKLAGIDLVDRTPILDIKPYIPYSDSHSNACAGYAQQHPAIQLLVTFSEVAKQQLLQYQYTHPTLETLIIQVIGQDPRPAYKRNQQDNKRYIIQLYHFTIRWVIEQNNAHILSIISE